MVVKEVWGSLGKSGYMEAGEKLKSRFAWRRGSRGAVARVREVRGSEH